MTDNQTTRLYSSSHEQTVTWAFRRASRHQGLDVRLNKAPDAYTYWLVVSVPDDAGPDIHDKFDTITNELATGHEYGALKLDKSENVKNKIQSIFNM